MPPPEILVTGVGIVSPAGATADASWSRLLSDPRCIIARPRPEMGGCGDWPRGEVRDPGAQDAGANRRVSLLRCAMEEAIEQARLSETTCEPFEECIGGSKGFLKYSPFRSSAFFKTGIDSSGYINDLLGLLPSKDESWITDKFNNAHTPYSVAACASGTIAIIRGVQSIQDGDIRIAVCAAADASLHPLWLGAYEQMGVLARGDQHGPSWACRPFDRHRAGFVVGEGAGAVVLETAESACRRGVRALARIEAVAMGTDPAGMTQLTPGGSPLAHVVSLACARAHREPEEIRCIYAHGTATRDNDRVEALALRRALGEVVERIPIVSLKGAIGHLLGAAGAVEVAMAILACVRGQSPGNATLKEPDAELGRLRLPTEAFDLEPGPILKTSLGFGGHLAALIVGPA